MTCETCGAHDHVLLNRHSDGSLVPLCEVCHDECGVR